MLPALVLLIVLLLTATVLLFLEARRLRGERDASGLREQVGRTVAVHLSGKVSVQGVLIHVYRDGIALAHPKWLSEAQPTELGGEAFVPHREIAFFQIFDTPPEG